MTKTAKTLITLLGIYAILILMDLSAGHEHHYTLCIFKNITGIPCPGCGMGRGTLALLNGNFVEAFSYNILCIPFSFCVLLSVLILLSDVIRGKDTFLKVINRPVSPVYLLPLFVLTAISWTVNILRNI